MARWEFRETLHPSYEPFLVGLHSEMPCYIFVVVKAHEVNRGNPVNTSPQVNQLVELPSLRLQKKVKSMQMFRKPVSIARYGFSVQHMQRLRPLLVVDVVPPKSTDNSFPPTRSCRAGDRVGMCVASLDAKLMERGVVTTPGSVRPISAAIALVRKVGRFETWRSRRSTLQRRNAGPSNSAAGRTSLRF